MKSQTIKALNQVNSDFYTQIAVDFSATRQHPWPGWAEVATRLTTQLPTNPKILDVGCGNGRLAAFAAEHWSHADYTGFDNNQHLLKVAKSRELPSTFSAQWAEFDLVESLLSQKEPPSFLTQNYDLVTLFGVMHHIPSFELRRRVLATLLNQIVKNGFLVFTIWRFLDTERLARKQVDFSTVGVNTSDLEPNDYLLDWKRGSVAYRYCHYIDDQELAALIQDFPAHKAAVFSDDAKEGNVNLYVILQKTT